MAIYSLQQPSRLLKYPLLPYAHYFRHQRKLYCMSQPAGLFNAKLLNPPSKRLHGIAICDATSLFPISIRRTGMQVLSITSGNAR